MPAGCPIEQPLLLLEGGGALAVPLDAVPLEAVPLDAVPLDALPLEAVPLDAVPLDDPAPASGGVVNVQLNVCILQVAPRLLHLQSVSRVHQPSMPLACSPAVTHIGEAPS